MTAWKRKLVGYAASLGGVAIVSAAFSPVYNKIQDSTAASVLLLLVLVIAIKFGTGPAVLASVLSAVYINFLFVPPLFKLQIATGYDLVALVTFLLASIMVGQLSARAQRRTTQVQVLYDRLREAFEKSSKLEAIRQCEQLKSALLDAVTHDLRTPLTSIKAAASALITSYSPQLSIERLDPANQKEFLNMIVEQADRLNHFIDGMIELAKVEAGHFGDTGSTDSAEEIISAALARAERLLEYHDVRCICDESLMVSSVSPKAIAQVVFSLLENASRHSPRGSEIAVRAARCEEDGIQIAVEDEGPGIPEQYRNRVFDKFFQLEGDPSNSSHIGPGLGLGLAIAKGIVEAHRGNIWIEDRKDGSAGTCMVFTLPGKGGQPGNTAMSPEELTNGTAE